MHAATCANSRTQGIASPVSMTRDASSVNESASLKRVQSPYATNIDKVSRGDTSKGMRSLAGRLTGTATNTNLYHAINDASSGRDDISQQTGQPLFDDGVGGGTYDEYHGRREQQREGFGGKRPATADNYTSGKRVREMATDAIFKKWGFKNPSNVLQDCVFSSYTFASQKTFKPQHKRLLNKVD